MVGNFSILCGRIFTRQNAFRTIVTYLSDNGKKWGSESTRDGIANSSYATSMLGNYGQR
jgi:hypothetical protein